MLMCHKTGRSWSERKSFRPITLLNDMRLHTECGILRWKRVRSLPLRPVYSIRKAEGEQEEMVGKEGGEKRCKRCLPRRHRCQRLCAGRVQCEAKHGGHAHCLRPGGGNRKEWGTTRKVGGEIGQRAKGNRRRITKESDWRQKRGERKRECLHFEKTPRDPQGVM